MLVNPFELLYSFSFVVLVVCAFVFYKAAELDKASRLLWTTLSAVTFLFTWLIFQWGWIGCLTGQLLLFVGITLVRVVRS